MLGGRPLNLLQVSKPVTYILALADVCVMDLAVSYCHPL